MLFTGINSLYSSCMILLIIRYFDTNLIFFCYSYFLTLHVSDESAAETKFLLFDQAADELIGRPASALVEEAAEVLSFFVKYILIYRQSNF